MTQPTENLATYQNDPWRCAICAKWRCTNCYWVRYQANAFYDQHSCNNCGSTEGIFIEVRHHNTALVREHWLEAVSQGITDKPWWASRYTGWEGYYAKPGKTLKAILDGLCGEPYLFNEVWHCGRHNYLWVNGERFCNGALNSFTDLGEHVLEELEELSQLEEKRMSE